MSTITSVTTTKTSTPTPRQMPIRSAKTCYWFLRASAFNLCFYIISTLFCIILLPVLLVPHKLMMKIIHLYLHINFFLEKYILGLTYEIRGAKNLPQDPPYIVAAKHQSTYETLKLHFLFKNPAPVLKKELLNIPLWGKYLEKSDVIAIDRSSPKAAIKSIKESALRVTAQKRPIIIFPQGTRVSPGTGTDEKPYKMGVTRIQNITNLPIIPMATNAGVYYPKGKWCRKPGCVIFEFLPAIEPSKDRPAKQTLKQIEDVVEEKSNALMNEAYEALHKKQSRQSFLRILIISILTLFTIYSTYWFYSAHIVKTAYINWIEDTRLNNNAAKINSSHLRIYGYPGKLHAALPSFNIQTQEGMLEVRNIHTASWPFPNKPIMFQTENISVTPIYTQDSIEFDSLNGSFKLWENTLDIENTQLKREESSVTLSGIIKAPNNPSAAPQINMDIVIKNYSPFLLELVQRKIVDQKPAMIASIVLQAFTIEDEIHTNVTTQGNSLFLGPVHIYDFP